MCASLGSPPSYSKYCITPLPYAQRGNAMTASDRRGAPRFRISIPLHFQIAKSADPECHAESVDISSRGVLMETDAPPGIGSILEVRLRMPEMIMGWRVP